MSRTDEPLSTTTRSHTISRPTWVCKRTLKYWNSHCRFLGGLHLHICMELEDLLKATGARRRGRAKGHYFSCIRETHHRSSKALANVFSRLHKKYSYTWIFSTFDARVPQTSGYRGGFRTHSLRVASGKQTHKKDRLAQRNAQELASTDLGRNGANLSSSLSKSP